MKAEKEPEEFEFGCEDLTKDWFDEISDMEEPEEKIKCDENDFFDNEQDSVEPDSKPDKARTGGIWDWDSEDYWAYGESERSLLEMAHKDMLCIAGLLEVMDSLALLADTQGRELQSGLSDVSVKLKDRVEKQEVNKRKVLAIDKLQLYKAVNRKQGALKIVKNHLFLKISILKPLLSTTHQDEG